MDDRWRQETRPLILEGGIHMPYSWTVGRVGSRFFIELRDQGTLLANRCGSCRKVWIPPRLRCPVCFQEMGDDWTTVGPEGTLRHFTIVRYAHPAQPIPPPLAYGLIDLDGADCAIAHLIGGKNPEGWMSGMRVRPVLKPERQGHILDILYFIPIGGTPQ